MSTIHTTSGVLPHITLDLNQSHVGRSPSDLANHMAGEWNKAHPTQQMSTKAVAHLAQLICEHTKTLHPHAAIQNIPTGTRGTLKAYSFEHLMGGNQRVTSLGNTALAPTGRPAAATLTATHQVSPPTALQRTVQTQCTDTKTKSGWGKRIGDRLHALFSSQALAVIGKDLGKAVGSEEESIELGHMAHEAGGAHPTDTSTAALQHGEPSHATHAPADEGPGHAAETIGNVAGGLAIGFGFIAMGVGIVMMKEGKRSLKGIAEMRRAHKELQHQIKSPKDAVAKAGDFGDLLKTFTGDPSWTSPEKQALLKQELANPSTANHILTYLNAALHNVHHDAEHTLQAGKITAGIGGATTAGGIAHLVAVGTGSAAAAIAGPALATVAAAVGAVKMGILAKQHHVDAKACDVSLNALDDVRKNILADPKLDEEQKDLLIDLLSARTASLRLTRMDSEWSLTTKSLLSVGLGVATVSASAGTAASIAIAVGSVVAIGAVAAAMATGIGAAVILGAGCICGLVHFAAKARRKRKEAQLGNDAKIPPFTQEILLDALREESALPTKGPMTSWVNQILGAGYPNANHGSPLYATEFSLRPSFALKNHKALEEHPAHGSSHA